MQLTKHQRVQTLNVRFSPAQFHQSLPSFLKGILNRRVVKESHRDAPYKGIPPTLLFFPLFFLIFFFFFFFSFVSFNRSSFRSSSRELPSFHSFLVVMTKYFLIRYKSLEDIVLFRRNFPSSEFAFFNYVRSNLIVLVSEFV